MNNVFYCVGNLQKDFELEEIDGKTYAKGVIAVETYNNDSPQTELEFYINENIYKNIDNMLKVGDCVGLRSTIIGNDKGVMIRTDKISFLHSDKTVENFNEETMER